jgi:general stress protein 26
MPTFLDPEDSMSLIDRLFSTLRREDDFLLALATVDSDGCPHVRYMKGVIDDQLIIRCPTFVGTGKMNHIRQCADVSLTCGDIDSRQPGSYFQITAKATISQASEDRKTAWTQRMEKWFSGPDDANYAVVRIVPVTIRAFPIGGGPASEVWTA